MPYVQESVRIGKMNETEEKSLLVGGDRISWMERLGMRHKIWSDLSSFPPPPSAPASRPSSSSSFRPPPPLRRRREVWVRLRKTVAVMVGDASMREFPEQWEAPGDRMAWSDQRPRAAIEAPAEGSPALEGVRAFRH